MSIQSITCLFLTVTPLLTLYATDKIVNLFFMNVLKWQNFTPWRQIVNFTCCLIQEGVVLSLIDQRVTKRYFPACQTFGRKLDLVCLLGYLLYKIPQIDESVLDPNDIPVGPNRDLLELWGKLSEQSKFKYSCYYNKKYPERYDLSNQFKAWITAHQIQLKELDLAECDLNVFPPILLLLTQLHTLSLKKNSFTKFPSEVFQFQKLECLDLSDNQISEIPKDLPPPNTVKLSFSSTQSA
jgi:hypothetical protein